MPSVGRLAAFFVALAVVLTGCGGGGGEVESTDGGMSWDSNTSIEVFDHKGKPLECVNFGSHKGYSCDWVKYHSNS